MKRLLLALTALLIASAVVAQNEPTIPYDVFVQSQPDGGARLLFQNLVTGRLERATANGDQFLVTPAGVVFRGADGRVMLAPPGGPVTEHPFIRVPGDARRVDWIASADGSRLAWTITAGEPTALTTETWVADSDGGSQRLALRDGPHSGIRAFPVAFSDDGATLYMDFQPDTIAELSPFRQYAALFSVDLDSGDQTSLPGEAGCYCGGDIRDGQFMRLVLGESGFDIHSRPLPDGSLIAIDGPGLSDYTLGGGLLLAPGGQQAVYALARTTPDGRETVFVRVDLATRSAEAISSPALDPLEPAAWTQSGDAVLLTRRDRDGTWRLDVKTGAIEPVADATYIGSM